MSDDRRPHGVHLPLALKRQIRDLLAEGHTLASVARVLGCTWAAVKRYQHWDEANDPEAREEVARLRIREAPAASPTPSPLPAGQVVRPVEPEAVKGAPKAEVKPVDPIALLRKTPLTLPELAERLGWKKGETLDWIDSQTLRGLNIHEIDGKYSIEKDTPLPKSGRVTLEIISGPDNRFAFGAMGDTHLGSKYARRDVLNDLYRCYAEAGIDTVFHAGNWIDGEARFNKFDLIAHGMDGQLAYLAEHYPNIPGIKTYAIAGDDHEGWYAQREGVNIGKYAEHVMRESGRDDWHDMGYMECYVRLVNRNTGKSSMLCLMHPGGGSAYATSYTVQKIVESFGGGEKPAVLLAGHYHKSELINVRNVWCAQTGCCQDQTPFMRKKKLEAHLGGHIIRLVQDPETGAIVEMNGMRRYFNTGYYNDRFSHSGDVVLPQLPGAGR